jgi:hypothetical protein
LLSGLDHRIIIEPEIDIDMSVQRVGVRHAVFRVHSQSDTGKEPRFLKS